MCMQESVCSFKMVILYAIPMSVKMPLHTLDLAATALSAVHRPRFSKHDCLWFDNNTKFTGLLVLNLLQNPITTCFHVQLNTHKFARFV